MPDLFASAYAAKRSSSKAEFVVHGKEVFWHFIAHARLLAELKRQSIAFVDTDEQWIDLFHALWHEIGSHSQRHAVQRLIERCQQEKWQFCSLNLQQQYESICQKLLR